jgi:hypothetical protein
MHCFSPGPGWYEPVDVSDEEPLEVEPPADDLVVTPGACSWFSTLAWTDDDA